MSKGAIWAGRGRAAALWMTGIVGLGGVAGAQSNEPLWVHQSDGSWNAETVSLGNDGTQVFAEYGGVNNSRTLLSAHDTNPPSPVWTDNETVLNYNRRVDSSAAANVHASLHQEDHPDFLGMRQAVLTMYGSDSAAPDWVYRFEQPLGNYAYDQVWVSADGQQIVTAIYDSSTLSARVASFAASSSTPVLLTSVSTSGGFDGFAVSEDGSTIALRSNMRLVVVDLDSGSVRMDLFVIGQAFYGGLDLSEDGRVLAVGTGSRLEVYEETAGGSYALQASYEMGSGNHCRRVAMDATADKLAFVINSFGDQNSAEVRVIDRSSGEALVQHSVTGAGGQPNFASSVAISRDGRRVAAGLWGDEQGLSPNLLVFDTHNPSGPAFTHRFPGSVMSLDLSPDGRHLAVAARDSHATAFGGGGSIALFEAGPSDLRLEGTPRVGNTVNFLQRADQSSISRVVVSPLLETTPVVFPSAGTLYLDRSLLSWVSPGSPNGEGEMVTPYQVPSDAGWVGTSFYFQGVGLAPRSLSDNYVKLTVLP